MFISNYLGYFLGPLGILAKKRKKKKIKRLGIGGKISTLNYAMHVGVYVLCNMKLGISVLNNVQVGISVLCNMHVEICVLCKMQAGISVHCNTQV